MNDSSNHKTHSDGKDNGKESVIRWENSNFGVRFTENDFVTMTWPFRRHSYNPLWKKNGSNIEMILKDSNKFLSQKESDQFEILTETSI